MASHRAGPPLQERKGIVLIRDLQHIARLRAGILLGSHDRKKVKTIVGLIDQLTSELMSLEE